MKTFSFICCIVISFLFACQEQQKQKPVIVNHSKLKENIINVNKPAVIMENDEIEAYIRGHNYTMQKTGTGLRYMVRKENTKGEKIQFGDEVKVNFQVKLLDGTLCYSSDKTGAKKFVVGSSSVESGLHEGIQLLRNGEKAVFILPSHLAHGLVGDRDKIPPKASVVYEIEVISVNNK